MSSRQTPGFGGFESDTPGNNSNDFASLHWPPPNRFNWHGIGRRYGDDDVFSPRYTWRDWMDDFADSDFPELPRGYAPPMPASFIETGRGGTEIPHLPNGLSGQRVQTNLGGPGLSNRGPNGEQLPPGVYWNDATGTYWFITQPSPGFDFGMQFYWKENPPPQIGGSWHQYTGNPDGSPFDLPGQHLDDWAGDDDINGGVFN